MLAIPITTRTEMLFKLGVHNTMDELAYAQSIAQITRLSGIKEGRNLLSSAGLQPGINKGEAIQFDNHVIKSFILDPCPRNMNPQFNRIESSRGQEHS